MRLIRVVVKSSGLETPVRGFRASSPRMGHIGAWII